MPSAGAVLSHLAPTLAQARGPDAATLFYLTLLFIFLTAIITTAVTRWARDKCLKLFHRYHVTVERMRGQTIYGNLKAFSTGIEVQYDHAFVDVLGRRKRSFLIYQQEMEQSLLSVLRYHDELDEKSQKRRRKQVRRTFNPGPIRRTRRAFRNFVNTLRDAFNAAIGTAVGHYQRLNPGST